MPLDDTYTKVLLHFDGADASTTITDESGKSWTPVGTAQLDTDQKKFGPSSLLLNGSSDHIYTDDTDDVYFGSGDFTIDGRIMFNSTSGVRQIFIQYQNGGNYAQAYFSGNNFYFNIVSGYSSIVNIGACAFTPSTGVWYHYALVRTGNDWKCFMGGTQIGTTLTDADAYPNLAATFCVGGFSGGQYFSGWFDEFRVSKGVARWTSNFVPPRYPYALPRPGFGLLMGVGD